MSKNRLLFFFSPPHVPFSRVLTTVFFILSYCFSIASSCLYVYCALFLFYFEVYSVSFSLHFYYFPTRPTLNIQTGTNFSTSIFLIALSLLSSIFITRFNPFYSRSDNRRQRPCNPWPFSSWFLVTALLFSWSLRGCKSSTQKKKKRRHREFVAVAQHLCPKGCSASSISSVTLVKLDISFLSYVT